MYSAVCGQESAGEHLPLASDKGTSLLLPTNPPILKERRTLKDNINRIELIVNENIFNKFPTFPSTAMLKHSESMMSQTNTIAILGYDASTACICSTHPLIKHWLGVARDAATPSVLFVAR